MMTEEKAPLEASGCRQAFELWMRSTGEVPLAFMESNGCYVDSRVQGQWMAYRAAWGDAPIEMQQYIAPINFNPGEVIQIKVGRASSPPNIPRIKKRLQNILDLVQPFLDNAMDAGGTIALMENEARMIMADLEVKHVG